jgi:hypothetical protein
LQRARDVDAKLLQHGRLAGDLLLKLSDHLELLLNLLDGLDDRLRIDNSDLRLRRRRRGRAETETEGRDSGGSGDEPMRPGFSPVKAGRQMSPRARAKP